MFCKVLRHLCELLSIVFSLLSVAPDIRTSAIYYFVTAIVTLLIAFDAYFILPITVSAMIKDVCCTDPWRLLFVFVQTIYFISSFQWAFFWGGHVLDCFFSL